MTAASTSSRVGTGAYFFLSYAHLQPTAGDVSRRPDLQLDADPEVRAFFDDLSAKVGALARPTHGRTIGLIDQTLKPGDDWKASLADSLGTAEVLVPLYEPRYIDGAWPMSERAAFHRRLDRVPGDTRGHVQPVLWIPLPPGYVLPDDKMPAWIEADLPDYPENGLRAMRVLTDYQDQYRIIVDRLARRIVDIAERRPIGPSPAPLLGSRQPSSTPQFVVAVLAPTRDTAPPGRRTDVYGRNAAEWRPFAPAPALPVAQLAANFVERLGLRSTSVDIPGGEKEFARSPSALLVDPWVLATPGGRAQLESALKRLRDWVTLVVVTDSSESAQTARGTALFDDLVAMLSRAGAHRIDVGDVDDFTKEMPTLVTRTRRRFLDSAPSVFSALPRLTDPSNPTSSGDFDL